MGIFGIILLVLIGLYLLIVSYGTACLEIGLGGGFPKFGILAFFAAVGAFWAAYYFSPITIRMVIS